MSWYDWTVHDGALYHRTLLVDREANGEVVSSDCVSVRGGGNDVFHIPRSAALRSPAMCMMMDREQAVYFPTISDESLRWCLSLMFGTEATSVQVSEADVRVMFLDELPLSWIEERPTSERLQQLSAHFGIQEESLLTNYMTDPTRAQRIQSLFVATHWYRICGTHNTWLYSQGPPNVSLFLHVVLEPQLVRPEVLDGLTIGHLSHNDVKLLSYLQSALFGMFIADRITDTLITVVRNKKNVKVWLKWAFGPEGWSKRRLTYHNQSLLPDLPSLRERFHGTPYYSFFNDFTC